MLPQDRIEIYGDKPIEKRAKHFSKMASDNYPYQHQLEVGYLNGATEQRIIDIRNALAFLRQYGEGDFSCREEFESVFRKAMDEE